MIYNKDYKIKFYRDSYGYIDEPYGRHITGKIRELRVDFSNNYYRILYFTFIDKNIVILHAFLKRTNKTPNREINIAINRYNDFVINYEKYEK